MRKIILTATAVIALVFSFSSCSKEDEAPVYKDIRWVLEQPAERFGNTLVFNWEYKAPPKVDVWFLVKTFFKSDSAFSLEGQEMDAEHFFATIFNGLLFYNDGCVTTFYKPKPYMATAPWKESYPKNAVIYNEAVGKNTLFLTVNMNAVEDLLASELCPETASCIADIISDALPEKIVANYTLSRDKFTIYLTRDSIVPILSAFLPLIGFTDMAEEMDACIKNTESLNFGFNFRR